MREVIIEQTGKSTIKKNTIDEIDSIIIQPPKYIVGYKMSKNNGFVILDVATQSIITVGVNIYFFETESKFKFPNQNSIEKNGVVIYDATNTAISDFNSLKKGIENEFTKELKYEERGYEEMLPSIRFAMIHYKINIP